MGEVEPAECQLLLNSESKKEGGGEVVRMGGDSEVGTDSGLTSLRAVWFLVLWYFFSGGQLFGSATFLWDR